MKLETTRVGHFSGSIFLGLHKNYTDELISKEGIYNFLQAYQRDLINSKSIYLSAAITEMDIVLSGQIEPHLQIRFINYPRFPISKDILEQNILELAKELMLEFDQNRTVVEFKDEIVMLQISKGIDPAIEYQ